MPPEPARVEKAFAEALAKTNPADRADVLNRLCGEEIELRQRVEALLAAHEAAGSFLPLPMEAGPTESLGPKKSVGEQIGPYLLIELIGEGGMGEVWVAKQTEPLNRKVALKLIKPGMDSKVVLARFEQERHTLALMDHPSIARVFDGGLSADGRPFFVMELVNGLPLTKFCDDAKLTPRERLELFVTVCQAVQHAHQKGIVHRDLKPSNVLVTLYDGKPVPKVIDFGLAKAIGGKLTGESLSTQFGSVLGTLEYMAPEQAGFSALDVDTRADIYALGVILYELLTGLRPFDSLRMGKAALDEVVRILREEEPPRPSTRLSTNESLPSLAAMRKTEPKRLTAMMRGELDWVVMKCLEKDRNRRYETANGLARDVQRYLTDEAVEARPPSAGYRMRKFARKYRRVLATASVFVGLLVLAAVVSTWLAVRATVAESAATQQRDEAVKQRQRADEEAAIAKAVHEFLQTDLLAQADPYKHTGPSRNVTMRTALDSAAARVGGRFERQSLVEAALRQTIGEAYHSLGEYEKARQHLERALEIRRRELAEDNLDTLTTMHTLARVLWRLGRDSPEKYAQAEPLFLQALEGRRKALGRNHPDTLVAVHGLAALYRAMEKFELAEPLFLQNLTIQRQTLGDEHFDTLETLNSLGVMYSQQGKWEQSERFATQAFEGRRKALGSEHPETLLSASNLARDYYDQKKYAQAEALVPETLEGMRKVLGDEHPWTLDTRRLLAQLYEAQGKDAQAEPLFAECLAAARQTSGSNQQDVATALANLGRSLLRQRKHAEAEVCLRECLQIRDKEAPNAWTTFNAKSMLGGSLLGQEKYAEAEPLLLKGYEGMKAREETIPPLSRDRLTEALERLLQLYEGWGKPDEAGKWRKELTAEKERLTKSR
jgi:serine/threonine protein kinase